MKMMQDNDRMSATSISHIMGTVDGESASSSTKPLIIDGGSFGNVPVTSKPKLTEISASVRSKTSTEATRKKVKQEAKDRRLHHSKDDETPFEQVDTTKLSRDLEEALQCGQRWYKQADETIRYHCKLLTDLPEDAKHTRDMIIEYQEQTIKLCHQKLKELDKALSDRLAESQEYLDSMRPKANRVRDATEAVPKLVKRLISRRSLPKSVTHAQKYLEELRSLNEEVNQNGHDLEDYQTLFPGDCVQLKLPDRELSKRDVAGVVNERVSLSNVGRFRKYKIEKVAIDKDFPEAMIRRRRPMVIFPEQPNWIGTPNSVTKSRAKATIPYIGEKVMLKNSYKPPIYSTLEAEDIYGSLGVVRAIEDKGLANGELRVRADFEDFAIDEGIYSDFKLEPTRPLEQGDQVRISRSIPEPSGGWRGVNGSSVGTVYDFDEANGEELINVEFPECDEWGGLSVDLELERDPEEGDKVQVKLSVKEPTSGWRGVSHEDIGILEEIEYHEDLYGDYQPGCIGIVKFPKKPLWRCLFTDIELARYHLPGYMTGTVREEFSPVDARNAGLAHFLLWEKQFLNFGILDED